MAKAGMAVIVTYGEAELRGRPDIVEQIYEEAVVGEYLGGNPGEIAAAVP